MKSTRGFLNVLTAVFLLLVVVIVATPAHAEFQLVERSTNTIGSTTVTWDSSFHDLTYSSPRLITVTATWNVDNGAATYADFLLNSFSPKSKKDPANGVMATPAVNSNNSDGSGEVTFQFRFTELHYDIERDTYIGNAHFQLMLNVDKNGDGSPDRVVGFGVNVHVEGVESVNTAPVADAGSDQTVSVDDTVTFDGSDSHDADGDPLTFLWSFESFPVGSTPVLSSTTAMNPTFVANIAGQYTLKLIVNDGLEDSQPDFVTITAEEEQPPPQGVLLQGDLSSLAIEATYDLDMNSGVPASEIEDDPNWGRIARTEFRIGFSELATVGAVNSLLESINGRIVNMLEGVAIINIRIPDPGNLSALETLIQAVEANSIVRFISRGLLPAPNELPNNISYEEPFEVELISNHLAVRGHAAWNAREALRVSGLYSPPLMVVTDKFGGGPPLADYDFIYVPSDFYIGNPHTHGYMVLSVIGADYGGSASSILDRAKATGLYPDTLPLRVVDASAGMTLADIEFEIIELVKNQAGGPIVINTSLGFDCNTAASANTNCTPDNANLEALIWIEMVRSSGVENAFLHIVSAGNIDAGEYRTYAMLDSPFTAARLMPLTGSVPNLTNTLVVENQMHSTTDPPQPLCLHHTSKYPGDISAIGTDVFCLAGSTSGTEVDTGTSLAAPQVAALAAYVWALKPSMNAQQVMGTLLTTMRVSPSLNPNGHPECSSQYPMPVIDAYEAVLALDAATLPSIVNSPVRFSILDFNGDNRFDANDLQMFISRCYDTSGAEPVLIEPAVPDYSRLDLNGDGWTGGSNTTPFDLDRTGSGQYGVPVFSTATQNIEGTAVNFNETTVSDSNILCYYAYSNLYSGDQTVRKEVLYKICHQVEPEPEEECSYDRGTDWCSRSCLNPVTGLTTTTYVGLVAATVTFSGEGTYIVYQWARAPEAPDPLCPPQVGPGSMALISIRDYVSGSFRYFTWNSALIPSHYYSNAYPSGKNCWPYWPMGYCSYDCPGIPLEGEGGGAPAFPFPGECSDWWGHYDEEGNWVEFDDP